MSAELVTLLCLRRRHLLFRVPRHHGAQPGACGAVPGAGLLLRACVWLLLQAEFLAIALVLVYVGAVMVLFLFVVMMLDIKVDPLREGFCTVPAGRDGRGVVIGRDVRVLIAASAASAGPRSARSGARCRWLATPSGWARDLHRLPAAVRTRGGHATGGHHRRHRLTLRRRRHQAPGPVAAGDGQARRPSATVKMRLVKAAAESKERQPVISLGHFLTLAAVLFCISVAGIFPTART
jgi:NADH-quinone oxidoreductase subunit J